MNAVLDTELFNAAEFDAQLANKQPNLELFRHTLRIAQEELKTRWLAGRTATELVPLRAALIDKVLIRAWRMFFEPGSDIALIAVGGYGRGELHPYSDIDLMLLTRTDASEFRDAIEAFLTFLWDIGLETGHSVRTVDDCVSEATQDITVATNLQEARLLLGPEDLFIEQQTRCGPENIWSGREFFSAKWQEQRRRHQKFNDTAYNLEPNFKDGPGGLRDIQMIGWVAKRHFGARNLKELIAHGFLTEAEYKTLWQGQALLWQIRFGIHLYTGRREDRLLFDHQRRLAKQLGYRDTPQHRDVEQFMKQYYRAVMELSRLNEMLLQLFQEEILYADESGAPIEINNRFQSRKGFLEAKNEQVFEKSPFALLEVFLLMAQNPNLKGVRANTIRMLRDHRHLINNEFRDDLACRSLFMELLRQGEGVTHELRRMNRYGILAAYLPVFGNIVGQMQHDLFHVYTVDEHTLFVIRNIRRFTVEEHKNEYPFCSKVIKSIPKQELLVIAGMFHDIAKGRGGDHSELGANDSFAFCRHHGLSGYDSRLVAWLVRNHLLMSTTAQKKDISDPEVVHKFATTVGDDRHLSYLYLLTVADIRATSPNLWNSWKDALLKQLYIETKKALRRGLDNPEIRSENIEQTKIDASTLLNARGLSGPQIDSLWRGLGDDYFLRFHAKEIAWHTEELLSHQEKEGPLILIDNKNTRGGTEIFVYTTDRLGLFARLTHILDQAQLNVLEARVINTDNQFAINTFVVLDFNGLPIEDPARISELKQRLNDIVLNPSLIPAPVQRRMPRQIKHFQFETEIRFTRDAANNRTVMEIIAYDRPGLLSRIGYALIACDIQVVNAKIATFGERAEDIFFIRGPGNAPIQPSEEACLRREVQAALGDESVSND